MSEPDCEGHCFEILTYLKQRVQYDINADGMLCAPANGIDKKDQHTNMLGG